MIEKKVKDFIVHQALLQAGDRVLVALSGGTDSVALLRLLLSLGYACEAVHCNFHLRGEESDRDEAFVRRLCDRCGVSLTVADFDTRQYARDRRISIEMAAREQRYEYFDKMRQQLHASAIAVAHHRNDHAETLLLNLIRGTGIHGLRGIRPRNGFIVRPLLCLSRAEITDYLHAIGQDYVTDSTNFQDEYVRNKIRLRLLPVMQEINPSIVDTLAETVERLAEADEIYTKAMKEACRRVRKFLPDGGVRIDIPLFRQEQAPQSLLYELFSPYGFHSSQLSDIYHSAESKPGKRFLSDSHEVLRDRDCWLIYPRSEVKCQHVLSLEHKAGEARLPDGSGTIMWECRELTANFEIPREPTMACLDADRLHFPLVLRRWMHGDKFVPFGMRGQKLVSDYMTDRKFSLRKKARQWLVCSGDQIVWVVGERSDNRFRIDEHTQRVCLLRLKSS